MSQLVVSPLLAIRPRFHTFDVALLESLNLGQLKKLQHEFQTKSQKKTIKGNRTRKLNTKKTLPLLRTVH